MADQVLQEDMEKRTRQFVEVRDLMREIEKRHAEELKDLKKIKARLSGLIEAFMDANNVTSLKTAAGTCYKSSRTTAPLADPQAFMDYVITNKAFDLLDRRANVTAVKAFIKQHKVQPPGCNLNTVSTIGVRRGDDDDEDE